MKNSDGSDTETTHICDMRNRIGWRAIEPGVDTGCVGLYGGKV